jgi:hypothetical protein
VKEASSARDIVCTAIVYMSYITTSSSSSVALACTGLASTNRQVIDGSMNQTRGTGSSLAQLRMSLRSTDHSSIVEVRGIRYCNL